MEGGKQGCDVPVGYEFWEGHPGSFEASVLPGREARYRWASWEARLA